MLISYGSTEGFKYIVFLISIIIWCFYDIYFLKQINKYNSPNADVDKSNKFNLLKIFIIFLIFMEFLFKWKISSLITGFADGKSYLLNWFVTFLILIPTFISYNLTISDVMSKKTLDLLEIFHFINLGIKIIITLVAVMPKTKNSQFTNFFKSGYYNFNNYKFSTEKC